MLETAQKDGEDHGASQAITEVFYRYLEDEPVGTLVAALVVALGVFGAIVALSSQPLLVAFLILAVIALLVMLFSPKARRIAFTPVGILALIAVTVTQGIASIVHTLLG